MHPALTTLAKAAGQLQLDGELERSEFGRIMAQLRAVAAELSVIERRTAEQEAASVNFTEMLRLAVRPALSADKQDRSSSATPLPAGIMVQGPAHDLRDLLSSLVEYAGSVSSDPIELRTQIKQGRGEARTKCATELVVQSPDLPDFLRRKLWDVARVRGGEVSVVSEPELCRIEFTVPVDRREAAADFSDDRVVHAAG
jgi:hypothetical protein